VLSTEERARAERLAFEEDRVRYVNSTYFLRSVLGDQVGIEPGRLAMSSGRWGKPYLQDGPAFNLSHSKRWALVGVAPEGNVGVDVEDVRPVADLESLIESTMHVDEARELLALPSDRRAEAFFRLWTRKEAVVKAVGVGLRIPPSEYCVTSRRAGTSHSVVASPPAMDLSRWRVRSVEWSDASAAAVAWDRPDIEVIWG